MDVTRRCDYACRILRAAYKSGDSYVSVSDIAEQEDIPYAFARSIQHDLVKGGLITHKTTFNFLGTQNKFRRAVEAG